jgi:hypothetical protein
MQKLSDPSRPLRVTVVFFVSMTHASFSHDPGFPHHRLDRGDPGDRAVVVRHRNGRHWGLGSGTNGEDAAGRVLLPGAPGRRMLL